MRLGSTAFPSHKVTRSPAGLRRSAPIVRRRRIPAAIARRVRHVVPVAAGAFRPPSRNRSHFGGENGQRPCFACGFRAISPVSRLQTCLNHACTLPGLCRRLPFLLLHRRLLLLLHDLFRIAPEEPRDATRCTTTSATKPALATAPTAQRLFTSPFGHQAASPP